jgi:hypothetical protein
MPSPDPATRERPNHDAHPDDAFDRTHNTDDTAGGADSSPFETLESGEKADAAPEPWRDRT